MELSNSDGGGPQMDDLDRQLLTLLRRGIPLEGRPYERLAHEIGMEASEALLRIGRLKAAGAIRRIAAVFDGKKLRYKTSLVAMSFLKEELDEKAEWVMTHPGISSCTARHHEFNLWFTLSVPPGEFLEHHAARLHEISGAKKTLLLPIEKILKHPLSEETPAVFQPSLDPVFEGAKAGETEDLTDREIRLIRMLQEDLPLVDEPFQRLAQAAEISVKEFLDGTKALKARGLFSGLKAMSESSGPSQAQHALIVWSIPGESIEKVGPLICEAEQVSHVAVRRLYRDFPYSVYAMVRASSFSFAVTLAQTLEARIGNWPRECLMTAKVFKKSRIRYFSEDLASWWRRTEGLPAEPRTASNGIPSTF